MIRNLTRGTTIAQCPLEARSVGARLRGMLGRRFDGFDAMVFRRCNSIHMWFMHMALDVIFVDRESRVCGLRESLRPWRLAWGRGADTVIEAPTGTISGSRTGLGDRLHIGS